MLGTSISGNSVILGLFALVTAAVLAGIQLATKDKISQAERRAAEKALLEIVPRERHHNDLLSDTLEIPPSARELLGLPEGSKIHLAKNQQGNTVAAIIPAVAPDGYSGDIKLIVGVNQDGTVAGVRVLSHAETPGLGDKIDIKKGDWILGFNQKSLQNPNADAWLVKKDGGHFDQLTGATITPRAIIKQVKNVLNVVASQRPLVFGETTETDNITGEENTPQD